MNSHTEHWQKWIPIFERECAVEIERAPQPCSEHANDHILRVLRRCIIIGKKLNADLEILVAAVYLHDLGMHYAPGRVHGRLSAEKAEPVLERICFPREKRDAVLLAIRTHDISASLEDRKTLESKILFDADKVDAFGVIGILRYIRVVYGKLPVDFIIEDIEMRWEGLSFPETREAVIEEYKYVKDYFIQLKKELEVGTYDGELDSVLTTNHDNLSQ
jgi:HD superfamily phosphohydrolase YqeK